MCITFSRVRGTTPVTTKRKLLWIFPVLLALGPLAFELLGSCSRSVYLGFDSRLKPELIGRFPPTKEGVEGFEIVRGKPLVAFPHLLLAYRSDKAVSVIPSDTVLGVTVDAAGHIRLQTGHGIQLLNNAGFEPDTKLSSAVTGQLSNSGNKVFLDATMKDSMVHLVARREDGAALPVANMKGNLRAVSWDEIGLAAVINDSLYVWEAGASQLIRLKSDMSFRAARSVCLVGPERAVVALPNVVVLVTEDAQTPIVGITARCDWAQDALYLLDERAGLIWTVTGLEQLGKKSVDQSYALALLSKLPANVDEKNPRFLEAARILGCEAARKAHATQTKSRSGGN
jgi:hypothetical protein